jgi:hypothetical protein
MSASPTSLTLRDLRADGYTAEVVERWNPHARVRHDLFGIVDVIAIRGTETLAVQATSSSNVAARVRKIAEAPTIAAIREAGWRFEVWGWAKKGARWECRKVDVS